MTFGSNLLMAHGDSARGREALQALDFSVHLDHFMTPTAEQADIVLPVVAAFEAEGLEIGFEVSQDAQSLVQLLTPLVERVGEARSDLEFIFELVTRLGLGEQFFHGDLDRAWGHQLAPSRVTVAELRDHPAGVSLPLETRHWKHSASDDEGIPGGFDTATGRIELHVEESATSPRSRRRDVAAGIRTPLGSAAVPSPVGQFSGGR